MEFCRCISGRNIITGQCQKCLIDLKRGKTVKSRKPEEK